MDNILTLSQAMKLTGFSQTKFTTEKNKALLNEHGAKTEGTGKNWQIPTEALVELEWLQDDGSPIPKLNKRQAVTRSRRSPIEVLEADIAKAEADLEKAEALKKDASARLKDARKKVDAVKGEALEDARRRFAEAQAEIERLEALQA